MTDLSPVFSSIGHSLDNYAFELLFPQTNSSDFSSYTNHQQHQQHQLQQRSHVYYGKLSNSFMLLLNNFFFPPADELVHFYLLIKPSSLHSPSSSNHEAIPPFSSSSIASFIEKLEIQVTSKIHLPESFDGDNSSSNDNGYQSRFYFTS